MDKIIDDLGRESDCFSRHVVDLAVVRKTSPKNVVMESSLLFGNTIQFQSAHEADSLLAAAEDSDEMWRDQAERLFEEFAEGAIAQSLTHGFLFNMASETLASFASSVAALGSLSESPEADDWSPKKGLLDASLALRIWWAEMMPLPRPCFRVCPRYWTRAQT